MSIEMIEVEEFNLGTQIKVIGVGGGGGNAVEHMISRSVQGVEFICANTDAQSLQRSAAHKTIQLGTSGLGAGSKPEKGRDAAEVAVDDMMCVERAIVVTARELAGAVTHPQPAALRTRGRRVFLDDDRTAFGVCNRGYRAVAGETLDDLGGHSRAVLERSRIGVEVHDHLGPRTHLVAAGDQQAVLDGVQALWAFGVALAHLMTPEQGVGEISGRLHGNKFPLWCRHGRHTPTNSRSFEPA